MALQASINFNGIAIPKAYIRVSRVFGGKREGWNSVVDIYADEAYANPAPVLKEDGTPAISAAPTPLEQFNCSAAYDPLNVNPLDLIYVELAKLPRFSGAVAA